jgi:hypothetical protein
MSRSDFWSIAATLIVAGIAYFVGGRVSAYGCIALGICIALYLLTTHKKEQSSSPVTLTSNPHQEVKQEANPTINVYAHPPEKPVAPAPRPKPKPTHNLHLHSCRMAKIEESMGNHGEMNGFHFPYNQSEPNAAVACIKNKSHEGGRSGLRSRSQSRTDLQR